jgi:hypothetical protein
MKNKNQYKKLFRYLDKTFQLAKMIRPFDRVRKGKQINDASVMLGLLGGLAAGEQSLSGIARHTGVSRSVLENLLNHDGLSQTIRGQIKHMFLRMKRSKMINLPGVKGRNLASVDGVETMRKFYTPEKFYEDVKRGLINEICQVAAKRDSQTDEIISFEVYHRLVVVSMIADRGPLPLAWRYQTSDAGEKYRAWLNAGSPASEHPANSTSEAKAKQEGELTVCNQLMSEIRETYRQMPFDILVADGLYDKSTVLTCVQSCGVALIASLKDDRRSIKQDAMEDFNTRPADLTWSEGNKKFEAWIGTYEDQNITGANNKVKICRIIREEANGEKIENYFYCSNEPWITPRLIEWCRHYRWKEENGFNAWTNLWGVLKHIFHHKAAACDAMIGLFFIIVIGVQNYRNGNLNRGCKRAFQTLREFLVSIAAGYLALRAKIWKFLREYLAVLPDTG